MAKIMRLIFVVLSLGLICGNVFAQKSSNRVAGDIIKFSKKNQKGESLTMPILKSATRIVYGFSNGSVHPDYQYQGYIIVTPSTVTLEIYHSSRECYSNLRSLTSKQYTTFLNNLYALGVKPNTDDPMMLDGAGVYELTIEKNKKVIFKGEENVTIVATKGSLRDAFEPLLDSEMKAVYKDPTTTFEQTTEDYFDDFTID